MSVYCIAMVTGYWIAFSEFKLPLFTNINMIFHTIQITFATYFFAFLISFFFEQPFLQLKRSILFPNIKQKRLNKKLHRVLETGDLQKYTGEETENNEEKPSFARLNGSRIRQMSGESFYKSSELRASSKAISDQKPSFAFGAKSFRINSETIQTENHLKIKLLKEHQC